MPSILNLTKTNKLILAVLTFVAVFAIGGGRAHAATLTVSGSCPLEDAITSVNNSANENTCSAVGGYNSNDTINIPAGTITLSADLPTITKSVIITGSGMNSTTIDGNTGQYEVFKSDAPQVSIEGIKLTAYEGCAISFLNSNVQL